MSSQFPSPKSRTPSLRTKLFYGFGSVAFGVKDNGFAFLLLIYYNQVLGLPERWVGLGIMVALVADPLFDPIVGYLSDHLHSRWGRRAIGFPRGARPGEVDASVVRNLGLVYVAVLVLLYTGALTFLSAYRISRAKHEANLEQLARGRAAADRGG